VRVATFVTIAAVAAAGPARADDGDDGYAPWRSPELGLGVVAQPIQWRGIGTQDCAFGPGIELAFGGARWQIVAEAALAYTHGETGMLAHPGGWVSRAGGALRWLARQYRPADSFAADFYLVTGVADERSWWADGTRLALPDATVGFGLTGRALGSHRIGLRVEVRVAFELDDEAAATTTCRGTCPMSTMPPAGPGLLATWGLVW